MFVSDSYISVRPIMISDIGIGHIGINPRYRRSDGNCPPISDVCNLKRACALRLTNIILINLSTSASAARQRRP